MDQQSKERPRFQGIRGVERGRWCGCAGACAVPLAGGFGEWA